MGRFQSPICVQTESPDCKLFLSEKSACEENWQQHMNFRGASLSSGLHENPSIQNAKVSSRESVEGNAGAKGFQSKLDWNSQGFRANENNPVGGDLNLLLDAIQLIEDEDQLKDVREKAKSLLSRPEMRSHQCSEGEDHKSAKELTSNRVGHRGDCPKRPLNEGNDAGQEAKPEIQTKRRRLQSLPSKYADSVLLPWK